MSTPGRPDDWWKSPSSDTANGCVEIACTLAAVRDPKNPDGPRLALDVRALVDAI